MLFYISILTNMNDLITFISGGSVLALILIGLIKNLIKSKLIARYGDLGVQVVLFIISLIIAFIFFGFKFIPQEILAAGIAILLGANGIYQVIIKSIYKKAIKGQLDAGDK